MCKVPDGSRCVNTELAAGRTKADPPTAVSLLPAVPRRGFLASLAAACGLATMPGPALGTLPGELLAAIPATSRVPVAIILSPTSNGAFSLCYVHPTMEHLTESFAWKRRKDERGYVAEESVLEFHGLGRCYMPVPSTIDLPGDEVFEPRHWLDFPTVPPDFGDIDGQGRLWEGVDSNSYELDLGEITTRHVAMQRVMEENRAICEGKPADEWELHNGAGWWVVAEFGAAFKEECWTTIELRNGIGKAGFNLELACRIAVPTPAELERFGKGGA